MDYMERTKILMGGDKITDQTVSGGRKYESTLRPLIQFVLMPIYLHNQLQNL